MSEIPKLPEQEIAIGGTTYCPKCGEENYPMDCCTCKSPATVQPPPQPVLERYHDEPSGKMWVESPVPKPPPQPAGGAGEKCSPHSGDCAIYGADPVTGRQSKICDCGYLRQVASSPIPPDEEAEAWCDHVAAIEAQYKLPCPRCAELERERDEARTEIQSVLKYMEKDYVKCFEGGQEEVIYASLALSVARVRAERDALKAKLSALAGGKEAK